MERSELKQEPLAYTIISRWCRLRWQYRRLPYRCDRRSRASYHCRLRRSRWNLLLRYHRHCRSRHDRGCPMRTLC